MDDMMIQRIKEFLQFYGVGSNKGYRSLEYLFKLVFLIKTTRLEMESSGIHNSMGKTQLNVGQCAGK